MSSFSLETSTPMCAESDFMLYSSCLEVELGELQDHPETPIQLLSL